MMMIMWRRGKKQNKKEVLRRNKNNTEVDVTMLTLVWSFCYEKRALKKRISYIAVKLKILFDCYESHAQTFVYTKHCPHNESVCT